MQPIMHDGSRIGSIREVRQSDGTSKLIMTINTQDAWSRHVRSTYGEALAIAHEKVNELLSSSTGIHPYPVRG